MLVGLVGADGTTVVKSDRISYHNAALGTKANSVMNRKRLHCTSVFVWIFIFIGMSKHFAIPFESRI